ncbi:MAG: MerR family transcriptional regulator [Fibrobacterota bacterium]
MSISLGKMYYSISEVCNETGLEQHVLRYWETEFQSLKPKKNRAGNRAYRKKDIDLIKYIKYLLYEKKFTIQGARKVLNEQKANVKQFEQTAVLDTEDKASQKQPLSDIKDIKKELTAIRDEIDSILKKSTI